VAGGDGMTSKAAAVIRPMTRRDIPAVATLEQEVYTQPWSVRVFFDELAQQNRAYFVAENGQGAIVGYGGLLLVEEDAHITTLAVLPEARRARLGTRLMLALVDGALEAGARHLTLEVRMSNAGARSLYERFGFAPVGLRKDYYRDEDALVMWAIDIDAEEYRLRLDVIRRSLQEAP
jgi:ribosomal-protein-alanine N-acetyltransferase